MADFRELIDALFARHKQRTAQSLALNAQRSYSEGQRYALMRMGGGFDWAQEEPTSYLYAQEYRRLMEEEGATIINGEKNYWFRDSSDQAKQDVLKIIEDGIAAGKPLGIKERVKGGYAKGTIAADLQPYFSSMRSHASMVARTEVGRVQNLGTCLTYGRYGIEEVTVLDDEGPNSCVECGAVNGQVWTIEYAMAHELEHPNCVRRFAPHVKLPKGLDEDVARYRAENPLPSPESLPWRDWRASKRMAAADAWLLNARRMPIIIEVQ